MIAGQKWLAQQLLEYCVNNKNITVTAVSPPNMCDRLAIYAQQRGVAITIHDKVLKQSQVPMGTDIILTAHAYCFITASARKKVKFGAVGYHPSLLPKYKGKTAIQDAIDAGEKVTGGSLYQLDEGWDTGRVILQDSICVDKQDTALSVWKYKLAPLGLQQFKRHLASI